MLSTAQSHLKDQSDNANQLNTKAGVIVAFAFGFAVAIDKLGLSDPINDLSVFLVTVSGCWALIKIMGFDFSNGSDPYELLMSHGAKEPFDIKKALLYDIIEAHLRNKEVLFKKARHIKYTVIIGLVGL